jgi:hypothetical protein
MLHVVVSFLGRLPLGYRSRNASAFGFKCKSPKALALTMANLSLKKSCGRLFCFVRLHLDHLVLARQAACMSLSRIKPHCPLPPPVSARHMACRSLSRIKPHWPLPPPVVARQ